jgi:elongation factor Ts
MNITAAQVKELRDKTGIAMMDCKKALIETDGDMEKAIENLRKKGQATAEKRAGKEVKQGTVAIVTDQACGIVFEVNSETDFVARNDDFVNFISVLGRVLLAQKPADTEAAKSTTAPQFDGLTIDARITELIGKVGEKIEFRRYYKMDAEAASERIFSYVHGEGKIGVMVKLSANTGLDSEELALLGKELALQVCAAKPMAIDRESVDQSVLAKEKEIYLTQAQNSGKPEKIWDKIVAGKMNKFFQEMTLMEQVFVKNTEVNVAEHIKATEKSIDAKISVVEIVRFELGAE